MLLLNTTYNLPDYNQQFNITLYQTQAYYFHKNNAYKHKAKCSNKRLQCTGTTLSAINITHCHTPFLHFMVRCCNSPVDY